VSDPQPAHATLVARFAPKGWRGVLFRGPSGSGKSTLALSLIGRGWRLVADDRVRLWRSNGRVWGRAPDELSGLLEVRGVGVLVFPALTFCEIAWVIDSPEGALEIERIPEPAVARLYDVDLLACTLEFNAPGAAEKVAAFCGALNL
jgi:serine kinase of HPr protein (carbohydrate metabolism regulator)